MYNCETWPLTLREKHRLGVFENRVLKKISGFKRDEVTGGWGRLCNKELYDLYSDNKYYSGGQVTKNKMCGVCESYGGTVDGVYRVLVGRTDVK